MPQEKEPDNPMFCNRCNTNYMYALDVICINTETNMPFRMCERCKEEVDNTIFQKYEGYHF